MNRIGLGGKTMMRFKPLALAILGGSLLFVSHASAVQLQYKVKAGDSWKLKTSMKGSGTMDFDVKGQKQSLPVEMTIESTPVQRITSVAEDGTFEAAMDYKVDVLKVLVGEKETPPPVSSSNQPIMTRADRFGRVLESQWMTDSSFNNSTGVDFDLIFSVVPNVFSDKDVNVGDTWEFNQQKNLPIKMTGKLLAVESDVARVEYTIEIPLKNFAENLKRRLKQQTGQSNVNVSGKNLIGKMTSVVNLSNGFPISSEGVMNMDVIVEVPGQFHLHQVIQLTMKRELVK